MNNKADMEDKTKEVYEMTTLPTEILPINDRQSRCKKFLISITVEPILFAYMMGVFIQYPVFQQLMFIKNCYALYNASVCAELESLQNTTSGDTMRDNISERTALWMMIFLVSITVPSVISAAFMGSWGDHFGRKLTMFLPNVGYVILTLNIIACSYYLESHMGYLLIGAVLSGLTGGFATVLLSVFSYITDITNSTNRTIRISVLESMTAVGGTVGLLLGGNILQLTGNFMLVFGISLSLFVFNLAYILLRIHNPKRPLADSIHKQQQQHMLKLMFNVQHVVDTIQTNFKRRPHFQHVYILLLNVTMFLLVATMAGDVTFLFLKTQLSFDASEYSFFLALNSLLSALGLLVFLRIFKQWLNLKDTTIAIIGVLSRIGAHILTAFSTSLQMVFFVPVVGCLGLTAQASVRSLLCTLVSPYEQGKLYSFVSSIECIAPAFATLIFNNLYRIAIRPPVDWPGICFIVAAILLLPCLGVYTFLYFSMKPRETCYTSGSNGNDYGQKEKDVRTLEPINVQFETAT